MNSENNKYVVRDFKRFEEADIPGALDLLHDYVTWRAVGRAGGLPLFGELKKKEIVYSPEIPWIL